MRKRMDLPMNEWHTFHGEYTEHTATSWNSHDGFRYGKCEHRAEGACLRCRFRWLVRLWRNGNHVWYLP